MKPDPTLPNTQKAEEANRLQTVVTRLTPEQQQEIQHKGNYGNQTYTKNIKVTMVTRLTLEQQHKT